MCLRNCRSPILQVNLFFDVMNGSPGISTVCEVGFNAGHSALAWLEGMPHVNVVSFDLGAHQYVTAAYEVLNDMYPNRLTLLLGDSAETIPMFIAKNPDFRYDVDESGPWCRSLTLRFLPVVRLGRACCTRLQRCCIVVALVVLVPSRCVFEWMWQVQRAVH